MKGRGKRAGLGRMESGGGMREVKAEERWKDTAIYITIFSGMIYLYFLILADYGEGG